jgi:hypothetical protein
VVRAKAQVVAVFQEHDGIIGLAKLAGALDNGVENRPDVGRRGGDHPEDVAATGLVGQSLRKVAGLGLHFLEQADIADRRSRLIGEGLQQGDLFVAERLHFGAAQHDRSNALTSRERGTLRTLRKPMWRALSDQREFVAFGGEVVHVHRLPVQEGSSGSPVSADRQFVCSDRYRSMMGAGRR